ncbi:hypothetical protein PsorP6_012986 [Peronosclerospora sorghi]|uniref:Uncharacterized protein n=1 Tax=Peronosclerospora sorghi TaxID=230839 RepID=A0ACC0WF12_9STRA|nr:hypothetical protein PsorP6_012986 [Peronosclerospora sorghi]
MGTDEEGFVGVLVSRPPEHLRIVAATYEKKYGKSLVNAAAHEFSGHAEKAVLFLIRMITEPLELLADLFEKAMKGFNTDENALSSAVVRYYIVLRDIKRVYKKKYGKELRERIAEECPIRQFVMLEFLRETIELGYHEDGITLFEMMVPLSQFLRGVVNRANLSRYWSRDDGYEFQLTELLPALEWIIACLIKLVLGETVATSAIGAFPVTMSILRSCFFAR